MDCLIISRSRTSASSADPHYPILPITPAACPAPPLRTRAPVPRT